MNTIYNLHFFRKVVKPECALFGLLHDVKIFGGLLSDLNSVGVRNHDGSPKESWNTVVSLGF